MKKTILVALAGVALLAAPLSAEARPGGGGGFHGGGGSRGAGGFHGGGGYRGGYRGGYGGYHRGYGYGGWALGAAGLGFVAGAALANQSYWDGYGDYGDYGYYGPAYPVGVDPGYAYPPPPQNAGPPPVACGQWVWDPGASRYNWVPGPCAAPGY